MQRRANSHCCLWVHSSYWEPYHTLRVSFRLPCKCVGLCCEASRLRLCSCGVVLAANSAYGARCSGVCPFNLYQQQPGTLVAACSICISSSLAHWWLPAWRHPKAASSRCALRGAAVEVHQMHLSTKSVSWPGPSLWARAFTPAAPSPCYHASCPQPIL